ncbi:MAG: hypothetical protein M3220_04865, partial [Chloroflexota bacterium]|nr:hypothetical protein [Chloroflexota bacterium]
APDDSDMGGAGIGAILGGLAGLLVGLASLTIPGIGPIVAAGPLAAALAGAGIGAVAGGAVGALIDMGVSEEDAEYYAEALRRGDVIVAVRTEDERADLAVDVLRQHAPIDLEARVEEWREEGWEGFDHEGEPYFTEVTDVLPAHTTDEPSLDSANVPDLDADSRAYMTNLDSDTSGSVEPAPDTVEAAIPDEERHPERTDEPIEREAVEPGGGVRVYGIELD